MENIFPDYWIIALSVGTLFPFQRTIFLIFDTFETPEYYIKKNQRRNLINILKRIYKPDVNQSDIEFSNSMADLAIYSIKFYKKNQIDICDSFKCKGDGSFFDQGGPHFLNL